MEDNRVGVCNAIIAGVSTKADGSIKLTLEVNPSEQEIISNLLKLWALNKRLVSVGIVSIEVD